MPMHYNIVVVCSRDLGQVFLLDEVLLVLIGRISITLVDNPVTNASEKISDTTEVVQSVNSVIVMDTWIVIYPSV